MKIRAIASAALFLSGLFLAACDSGSSPTSNPDPDKDPDTTSLKANGTLTVDGKAFPANISGLYGDTTVSLTVLTDFEDADTGWSLMVELMLGTGSKPMPLKSLALNGTHKSKASDTGCVYTVKSGSGNLDSWTVSKVGSYEMAKMSGSAAFVMSRWFLVSEGCPDVAMTLAFKDADAVNFDVVGDILGD
jgi:hypothetical protein